MIKITKVQYLAAISLLLVFAIDVFTPSHYVVDTLYICCIVITFKQKRRSLPGLPLRPAYLS